jgi:hypothetical protein
MLSIFKLVLPLLLDSKVRTQNLLIGATVFGSVMFASFVWGVGIFSDDRIKQIDAEHTFEVIDSPPQVTDDCDQRTQSQTETAGSAPIRTASADTTGSAPIPTASAAGSIDIDQSLAIEFPTASYEPHKSPDAIKRHPVRRAKVAAKRRVSNNRQANSEANSNNPKPESPPPIFSFFR